jgi:hypothetical protein
MLYYVTTQRLLKEEVDLMRGDSAAAESEAKSRGGGGGGVGAGGGYKNNGVRFVCAVNTTDI